MATENSENLNPNPNPEEAKPEVTLEDLQNQLAEAKALNQQYKNAITKSNGEAAEWKRKFQAKQTAEEKEADAKREAEELQQQEYKLFDEVVGSMEELVEMLGR